MMQASEAAGIGAMAQALVASGHLTQAAAGEMLAAQYAADGYEPAPASAMSPVSSAVPGATPSSPSFALSPGAAPAAPFLAHDPAPGARAGMPRPGQAQAGASPSAGAQGDAASGPAPDPAADPAVDSALDPLLAELQSLPIDLLFAPPESPDGYALELDPRVKMDPQDVSAVRHWFHTLRLPQAIAQSIYSETERMHRAGPLDAPGIERLTMQTRATLARAWGEQTDAMLGGARRLIDTAARAHPGLKNALARGPGSNPVIVRQLAEHAQRLYGSATPGAPVPRAPATPSKGN